MMMMMMASVLEQAVQRVMSQSRLLPLSLPLPLPLTVTPVSASVSASGSGSRRAVRAIRAYKSQSQYRLCQCQCRCLSSAAASHSPTMSAIQVEELGDESKLRLNTACSVPAISSTQCLVENHYAGLNFHDTYTRSGLYPMPLPFIVGCEGGGIVKEVGSDVKEVQPGDRVVYLQEGPEGSYAEYTSVEYTRLMPVPDDIDLDVATAAAVQGLTAHYLVNDSYSIQEGDWCVVHAAAGGTGQILVQMAKTKGATVIGTCSSENKAEIARKRGCDFVIVTKSGKSGEEEDDDVWPYFAEMVKEIIRDNTDDDKPILPSNYGAININDGAHVVFDSVGKASAMASLECLRPRGTAVFFGNASGAPPDLNPLLLSKLGSLSLTRPKMHDFIQTRAEVVERSAAVFQMLKHKQLDLDIQETFDFTRSGVIAGTKLLQERKTVGKVLFDIRSGLAMHDVHLAAAESIRASRLAPAKIPNLVSEHVPRTLNEAYDVQAFVAEAILRESDTRVIGKKIAATSVMAQQSVSVSEPFFGNVFSHSTFASDVTISINDATLGLQEGFLLIEPEFAVRLASDTDPSMVYTPETIKGCVGGILPSVEIVTSAFRVKNLEAFKNLGAASLIADNASHGALVLGDELVDGSGSAFSSVLEGLHEQTCTLAVNGETAAEGVGKQVLGHPVNALCWLANAMGKRGEILRAGDIVTTGVCVDALVLVSVGDSVSVNYGDLGEVIFNFVE